MVDRPVSRLGPECGCSSNDAVAASSAKASTTSTTTTATTSYRRSAVDDTERVFGEEHKAARRSLLVALAPNVYGCLGIFDECALIEAPSKKTFYAQHYTRIHQTEGRLSFDTALAVAAAATTAVAAAAPPRPLIRITR